VVRVRVVKVAGYCFAVGAISLENTSHAAVVERVVKSLDSVQFINPERVFDWDVFDAALVNAVLVYGTAKQKARSLANEVLLRLAATTQLENAINRVGLRDGLKSAVFVAVAASEDEAIRLGRKLVELSGCRELELPAARIEDRLDEVVGFYGLDERQISAVQAKTRPEAVKLLVMKKIASTIL